MEDLTHYYPTWLGWHLQNQDRLHLHMLGHKTDRNTLKHKEIIQNMFSDQNWIKLKINRKILEDTWIIPKHLGIKQKTSKYSINQNKNHKEYTQRKVTWGPWVVQ